MSKLKLSKEIQDLMRCPVCKAELNDMYDHLTCTDPACKSSFPIIEGIPVLLNEQNSIFAIEDFRPKTTVNLKNSRIKEIFRWLLPSPGNNIKGRQNLSKFSGLLLQKSFCPKILIIGGSVIGNGIQQLISNKNFELVETDVSFGPRTILICDAHDIPLENQSFDGVIVQAVLEHVVDPYRCVEEVHRVLKDGGIVYAETPFIQQVHMERYDFTRFTLLGHRRLFRKFDEIDSGAVCGSGMALAWAYQYFLLSFAQSKIIRSVIKIFASFTSFYLKYFDYYLINKSGTLDAASGYYFLGRKSDSILSDRELIKLYKGAQG